MEEPSRVSCGALGTKRNPNLIGSFHLPSLEKEMATHASVLAWRIPGTEKPGGWLSVGLQQQHWLETVPFIIARRGMAGLSAQSPAG